VPEVQNAERLTTAELGEGFSRVMARYGFMEKVDVPAVLDSARKVGVHSDPRDITYYLGRERLFASGTSHLARWRKKLYIFMSRNSGTVTEYFSIPPNRVVELGAQFEI
jgi:KUP system potassium uptake protein